MRDAVGNKIIHPYSDFLLHDIGTGDGIPVLPSAEFASTATQIRTAPLWALAHPQSADARRPVVHQAGSDRAACGPGLDRAERYDALTAQQKRVLLKFLDSL